MRQEKERAAATANSDHPAKENLHESKYSIPAKQIQAVSPLVNGLILRTVCQSKLIFTAVAEMQKVMNMFFGVEEKEFWLSVDYLTAHEYLVQCIDGRSTTIRGDQLKITAQGIRLLAGSIQDSRVTI